MYLVLFETKPKPGDTRRFVNANSTIYDELVDAKDKGLSLAKNLPATVWIIEMEDFTLSTAIYSYKFTQ